MSHEGAAQRQPEIAILLATYNGEQYLEAQLESIREQTCQDFVCYIHDDGSRDGTVSILKRYCEAHPDRFRLLDGPSCGGAKQNFFCMLRQVDAPYIMFSDQDDVWLPEKIEKTLNVMRQWEGRDEPVCVHSDVMVVDANLGKIAGSYYAYTSFEIPSGELHSLLFTNIVIGCTIMMNRSLRSLVLGNLDESLVYMHDWWVGLVASAMGHLIMIHEPLLLYRQHGNNALGARKKRRGILGKLSRGLHLRKMLRARKEQIAWAKKHAQALARVVPADSEERRFLEEFLTLEQRPFRQRVDFYRSVGTFRKGLLARLPFLWA